MDKLAVELLVEIFTLACTDGGYTSCALSRVCKHFREVSRPLRFYTVALSGSPRQLSQFLSHLEVERSTSKEAGAVVPKVRHLWLQTEDIRASEEHPPQQPSATVKGDGDTNPEASDFQDDGGHTYPPVTIEEYAALVSSLLTAVSPDLETFVLLLQRYAPPLFSGIVFPLLREMTLQSDSHDAINASPGFEVTLYPSLRRLHLLSGSMTVEYWARHAPRLTYLRVSGINYWTSASRLKDIHGQAASAATPFPRLRMTILYLNPPPRKRWCHGMPYVRYKRMVPALWESQAAASTPVYIFPPDENSVNDWEAYPRWIRAQWEERVKGGVGWWKVSEEFARGTHEGNLPPLYLTPWMQSKEQNEPQKLA